jgi:hypothetical protein
MQCPLIFRKDSPMRADMHRVFASSRHRRGQGWTKVKQKGTGRARPRIMDEDQPYREPVRSRKGFGSRRQKYEVVERYVLSQVGKMWTEVYSEVCRQMDARNEAQKEIREQIKRCVDEEVVLVDGEPFVDQMKGWRVHGVWVHPDTGILMPPPVKRKLVLTPEQLVERKRRYRRNWEFEQYKIDKTRRLVHFDRYEGGGWFIVTLKPLPLTKPDDYANWPHDSLSHCYFGDYDDFLRDQHRMWGDYVYAAEKRPASNRAIKKYTQPDLKLNTDKHVIKRTPA